MRTKIRVTTAAKLFGMSISTISGAKTKGRISNPGHGWCYQEEVAIMAKNKSIRQFAIQVNDDERAKRAEEFEKSMTYQEAAEFYGVSVERIIGWKRNGKIEGPWNRIWKGQTNPNDRPKSGIFGPRTLGGGAAYRCITRAPPIDSNEF